MDNHAPPDPEELRTALATLQTQLGRFQNLPGILDAQAAQNLQNQVNAILESQQAMQRQITETQRQITKTQRQITELQQTMQRGFDAITAQIQELNQARAATDYQITTMYVWHAKIYPDCCIAVYEHQWLTCFYTDSNEMLPIRIHNHSVGYNGTLKYPPSTDLRMVPQTVVQLTTLIGKDSRDVKPSVI